MPVIVIGADTPVGEAIVKAVIPSAAEVRAFISDERQTGDLKALGVKVALGDVSDFSHVEAAALNCFCAILIVEAAIDSRVRSFADNPPAVVEGWAGAIRGAGIHRTIWVSGEDSRLPLPASGPEVATVFLGTDRDLAARQVAHLEGLSNIPI